MKRLFGGAALTLVVAACVAPPPRPTAQNPPLTGSVEELAAAIAADARRSDQDPDAKTRADLSSDATRNAEGCLVRAPQAAACLYGRALALGLEARVHPSRATALLDAMLKALSDAEAADAAYDQAGPARVRALVLLRAPGWPLGPGDPEAALSAARRAATLRPHYPPNLLTVAEALAKTGDASGARENYQHARDAAEALPPSADRDEWLRTADQALEHNG